MPKVYVSGALTGVEDPESTRAFYEEIARAANHAGYEAYLPHRSTDPVEHAHVAPEEVYRRDTSELLSADVVVAWLGTPSLGVGAEVALAAGAGKRIVGLQGRARTVSRFIVGMLREAGADIMTLDEDGSVEPLVAALSQELLERRDAPA